MKGLTCLLNFLGKVQKSLKCKPHLCILCTLKHAFIRCFETVGWATGGAFGLLHLPLGVLFWKTQPDMKLVDQEYQTRLADS